jgi:hypothetical protein
MAAYCSSALLSQQRVEEADTEAMVLQAKIDVEMVPFMD